jgi:predicted metal-dependent TIM-barrel fold hydrolase
MGVQWAASKLKINTGVIVVSYATSKLIVNAHIAGGAVDMCAAIRTIAIANTNALNRRECFKANAQAARSTVAIHPLRMWRIMKRGCNQLSTLDLVN